MTITFPVTRAHTFELQARLCALCEIASQLYPNAMKIRSCARFAPKDQMTSEQTFLENDLWVHSREIFPQKNTRYEISLETFKLESQTRLFIFFFKFCPWVPRWVFPGLENKKYERSGGVAFYPGPHAVRGKPFLDLQSVGLKTIC